MAVKSPEAYRQRAMQMKPRLFMDGKPVADITTHPVAKTVVEANVASYEWAQDPEGAKLLTRLSHVTGEPCNLYNTLNRSNDDLLQRAAAGLYAASHLGTCIYRCVGCDAFSSLAATTFEMDRDLGTKYHGRLLDFLRHCQDEDLTVAGAMTEPRGRRDQKMEQWKDPDLSLHVVEKNDKGIVVNGAKINISGAYACDWTIVMPSGARSPGQEAYSLSFAVPNGESGLTYIAQYTPYSAERMIAEDEDELGNPRFGQRETSMIVFENVFVPWERVFLCGETKYAGRVVARFAQMHRMVCGGSCKVGFGKVLIGAARLIQEYKGLQNVPHINDQMTEMVTLLETVRACSKAAAKIANDLIAAYEQMIDRAHAKDIKVYGATLLPFGGSFYDTAFRETARNTVNEWIRSSGRFDAVIDLDAALRDPENPLRLLPAADTGDHLHPNETGHKMMAEAVDLMLFK
jgi:4-hydroxybutyryl-CoA dehydratase/vinylacetyl-CoA-Delta-isomerase